MPGDPALRVHDSVVELIGSPDNPTPMVRLGRVHVRPEFPVYAKLEWFNPFGSIKDRTARFLIDGLVARGELTPGKSLVEPTSGNTGIALVAIANLLGHRCSITIPSAVPEEKQRLLRLLGCELWPTPDDLCPIDHPKDGAIALAHAIKNSPENEGRYVMPNQYENPDNVRAHFETTGPEIWRQTGGRITHFVAGLGTCGTVTGVARYLKQRNPDVRVIGVEPQKGHRLPGLKNMTESKEPAIFDRSLVDEIVTVADADAYATTRRLIREESLLVGPSTGAAVFAALRIASTGGGLAVVISPDSVFKYGSFFEDPPSAEPTAPAPDRP